MNNQRIDKKAFVNKIISDVKFECINVVEFHFTDGTKISLETEVMSSHGIPTIYSAKVEE